MTTVERLQNQFDRQMRGSIFGEPVDYLESSTGILHEDEYVHVYRNKLKNNTQNTLNGSVKTNYDIHIRVCNKRITSVVEKNDIVRLPLKIGGPVRELRVLAIIDQDPATYLLGLGA